MASLLDSRVIILIARQEPAQSPRRPCRGHQGRNGAPLYQDFNEAWAYLLAGKKTEAAAAFAEATKQ